MIASLAMYPFARLRTDWEALWHTAAVHLDHHDVPLDWTTDHIAAARHPELLVGHTCGWPLITELDGMVDVVGTFDFDVPGSLGGRYRSVLIEGSASSAPVAVNSHDSLSGWVSWCVTRGRPGQVLLTGSHAASVQAVAEGRASGASIDAVSWHHLAQLAPTHVDAVTVVGNGPLVPCTPLITRLGGDVPALRAAFTQAIDTLPDVSRRLAIRGLVPFDTDDYAPLRSFDVALAT